MLFYQRKFQPFYKIKLYSPRARNNNIGDVERVNYLEYHKEVKMQRTPNKTKWPHKTLDRVCTLFGICIADFTNRVRFHTTNILRTATNWTGASIMKVRFSAGARGRGAGGGDSGRRDLADNALCSRAAVLDLLRIRPFIFCNTKLPQTIN